MIPFMTLWHYFRARRLRFGDRVALEAHQARQLAGFARRVLSKSPIFSASTAGRSPNGRRWTRR